MRYSGSNIKLIVNKLQVNYSDVGHEEAPVILFIHGFPLNMSMWRNQLEALKDTYRVITYDIRGHGESDAGNEVFSIDLFVGDLISFMNLLKINKASLCGLSMGGYIALNAILNYPDRFEALVLSDTQCMADSQETKDKRIEAVENIMLHGVNYYARESIKSLFSQESFSTHRTEVEAVKKMIVTTLEVSLCSTLIALASRRETFSRLSEILVPVLILVGEKDTVTPPEASEIMHKNLKNSSLHLIEYAGHLSNLENPEAFNQHLIHFFESVYKKHLNLIQLGNMSVLKTLQNRLNMLLSFRSI